MEIRNMKIYEVGNDEKCGGCNWEAGTVYYAAESQEAADEMYGENEGGLCADCLIGLFGEEGYEINLPADRR
jgi:hypothetical protein